MTELFRLFFDDANQFISASKKLNNEQQEELKKLCSLAPNCALLIGPSQSGKTSLLFQYAYSFANEGKNVTFISSKRKIQSSLPVFPVGTNPQSEVLKRIKMKYVEDSNSLRFYLANVHILNHKPEVIIVDDLSILCPGGTGEIAKSLAFMVDAIEYLSTFLEQTDSSKFARLFVSDNITNELLSRNLLLLERWVPAILKIEQQKSPFTLSVTRCDRKVPEQILKFKYGINMEHFELLSIEIDEREACILEKQDIIQ